LLINFFSDKTSINTESCKETSGHYSDDNQDAFPDAGCFVFCIDLMIIFDEGDALFRRGEE
jgi:hypothetical protein